MLLVINLMMDIWKLKELKVLKLKNSKEDCFSANKYRSNNKKSKCIL